MKNRLVLFILMILITILKILIKLIHNNIMHIFELIHGRYYIFTQIFYVIFVINVQNNLQFSISLIFWMHFDCIFLKIIFFFYCFFLCAFYRSHLLVHCFCFLFTWSICLFCIHQQYFPCINQNIYYQKINCKSNTWHKNFKKTL